MKLQLPYLEYEQPIGTFYMTVVRADLLSQIVDIRRRDDKMKQSLSMWSGDARNYEDGVQRQKSEERVKKISSYCSDPDATFPTPIIISVYNDVQMEDDGHCFSCEVDEGTRIGDVIDGQHRLIGIANSHYSADFMLPVALMFNLTIEEKAYIFSIINSTQTKVSMSLIYDLFDLSTKRSPQKTAHEIARSLNKMDTSPFYNRLKMLGKKERGQYYATLSQGTFVKQLLTLISKDPDQDSSDIKRGRELHQNSQLPLREYFIKGQDEIILKILLNCFTALKDVFPNEWKNPAKNVLWKTTGYGAIIKTFPLMYEIGDGRNDLSIEFFEECFMSLSLYMRDMRMDFSNEHFSGGGEQLQMKLAGYIKASVMRRFGR